MTFQTIVVLSIINNWKMTLLDVETAFLYRDLKEDIYMELPCGFFSFTKNNKLVQGLLKDKFKMTKPNKEVCHKLNRILYRLVALDI